MLYINTKTIQKKIIPRIKKLKFIDLLFLVGFFAFVALFIVFFSRSDQDIHVRLKVTDQNPYFVKTQPPIEYALSFRVDDIERNEVGKQIAKIQKIDSFQTSPDNYVMYLDLNIKANYNPLKKQYSYKGRPIIFGQDLEFDFENTKVDGLIVDFPGYIAAEHKPVTILAQAQLRNDSRQFSDTYGNPKFYADAIKVGDIVKDGEGNELVKVTGVKSEPAKRTILSSSGQSVTINDSELVDIYYTLEIKAYEAGGKLYFYDYQPIQVGNAVPLLFENVSEWPTITSYQKM